MLQFMNKKYVTNVVVPRQLPEDAIDRIMKFVDQDTLQSITHPSNNQKMMKRRRNETV